MRNDFALQIDPSIWQLGLPLSLDRPTGAAEKSQSLTFLPSSGLGLQGRPHSPAAVPSGVRSFEHGLCEDESHAPQFLKIGSDRFGEASNVPLRKIFLKERREVHRETLPATLLVLLQEIRVPWDQ